MRLGLGMGGDNVYSFDKHGVHVRECIACSIAKKLEIRDNQSVVPITVYMCKMIEHKLWLQPCAGWDSMF